MNKDIFHKFRRNTAIFDRYFDVDFFGIKTKASFEVPFLDLIRDTPGWAGAENTETFKYLYSSGRCLRASDHDPTMLHQDCEDFFEWIDLLTALDQAGDTFTMIELGAGYGRWVVNAFAAANRMLGRTPPKLNLHAIEMNPFSRRNFNEHLKQNNIQRHEINFHLGAIDYSASENLFYMWEVDDLYVPAHDSSESFGHTISRDPKLSELFVFPNQPLAVVNIGGALHLLNRVKAFTFDDIVPDGTIDFLNIDIQGDEANLIRGAREFILERVKHLHISTHSPGGEAEISAILEGSNLKKGYEYKCMHFNETRYGRFQFIDGIQYYYNTNF